MVRRDALDMEVERVTREVLESSPAGIRRAKELIALVPRLSPVEATRVTVESIATLRTGPEGQEGLKAFLDRRQPRWRE